STAPPSARCCSRSSARCGSTARTPRSPASPTADRVTTSAAPARAWQRAGLLLFAIGWGANHFASLLLVYRERLALDAAAPALLFAIHVALLGAVLLVTRGAAETAGRAAAGPLLRIGLDRAGWRSFVRGVVPMAPFVFAFPVIVFAALPSMLTGGLGRAPMA